MRIGVELEYSARVLQPGQELVARLGHLGRHDELAVPLRPIPGEVVLVVLLGRVERRRRLELGDDFVSPDALRRELGDYLPGDRELVWRVIEDHRAILSTDVVALAVQCR